MKIFFKILLFCGFIAALFFASQYFDFDKEKIDAYLKRFPTIYSYLIFVGLYVLSTVLVWYAKDVLKVVGAVVFGTWLSAGLIYAAEIINASIIFNLSRMLGKDFVERHLKGKAKAAYERFSGMNETWLFVFRAAPLMPYRVLDITFGLSEFPFHRYIFIVILASFPRILWIQMIIGSVRELSLTNIMQYFLDNKLVCYLSLGYFILAGILLFRFRHKLKDLF